MTYCLVSKDVAEYTSRPDGINENLLASLVDDLLSGEEVVVGGEVNNIYYVDLYISEQHEDFAVEYFMAVNGHHLEDKTAEQLLTEKRTEVAEKLITEAYNGN